MERPGASRAALPRFARPSDPDPARQRPSQRRRTRTRRRRGGAGAEAAAGGSPSPPRSPSAASAPGGRPTPRARREILVSFEDGEPKVALLEDGAPVVVEFDRPQNRRIVGNIYKGRVQNVLPGMQAAFVDIGLERNAFLFVDDARPGALGARDPDDAEDGPGEAAPPPVPAPRSRAGISSLVHSGEELLVQIVKEPSGSKGARVTRALSLPGRFLVWAPGGDHIGVSRRITDPAERERLRAVAARLREPGTALIVRTAAEGAAEADLESDHRLLSASWQDIVRRARTVSAPAPVHHDVDVVQRALRDHLAEGASVVVDRAEELVSLRAFAAAAAPHLSVQVDLAPPVDIRRGLFAARGVDAALERALGRRVALPSGAYLVIDQTEALTAVDVNTGRFVGGAGSANLADTFLAANLEAAAEIARQLRLRDIGGIIVVDFIDMDVPEHRRRVLDALEVACRPDRARPQILGITQLGLVEMTRKKTRQSLRELLTRPCPSCEGRGRVPSEESVSRQVRREIRAALRDAPPAEAALVEVNPAIASLLIGAGGQDLPALEHDTGRTVFVRGAADCPLDGMRLRSVGTRRDVEAAARPVREGQVLDLQVEEPHATSREDGIARLQGYVVDIEGAAARVGQHVRVEITKAFRTYARGRIV